MDNGRRPFEFGYAEAQITPDRHISLEGYEHRGTTGAGNAGVRDHLYVKVLALNSGADRALLISLDVCEFVPGLGDRFVAAVAERTGIEPEHVIVAATHTHSGPVLDSVWGARDLPEAAHELHGRALEQYVTNLVETVATTAAEACAAMSPGRVSGAHHQAVLGYNRRASCGGATDMLMSLWQHPETQPDGRYDPDIPVLLFERVPDDHLDSYLHPIGPQRIVLINPAFHPVVLGQHSRLVSGDYPGAACRFIEENLGDRTKAMFFLGASGDSHPFLATQTNARAVDIMGTAVGAGVLATLAGRTRADVTAPGIYVRTENMEVSADGGDPVRLHIIAFGSVAWVAISAELFTVFGMNVKRNSPFTFTFIVSLAGGSVWYLPSRDAFEDGGYEIEIATDRGIVPGTLELLERRVLDLLAEADSQLHSAE